MRNPQLDELFDIDDLGQEAERYRAKAQDAASEDEHNYLILMAQLSETMVRNEKMRAWLERAIAQLKSDEPAQTSSPPSRASPS